MKSPGGCSHWQNPVGVPWEPASIGLDPQEPPRTFERVGGMAGSLALLLDDFGLSCSALVSQEVGQPVARFLSRGTVPGRFGRHVERFPDRSARFAGPLQLPGPHGPVGGVGDVCPNDAKRERRQVRVSLTT